MQRQPSNVGSMLAIIVSFIAIALAITSLILSAGTSKIQPPSSPRLPLVDIDFTSDEFDLESDFVFLASPSSIAPPQMVLVSMNSIDASIVATNVSNDGMTSQDPNKGLIIDSSVFQHRKVSIFDHPKYLIYTKESLTPTPGNKVFVEATSSMFSTNIFESYFIGNATLKSGLQKYATGLFNPFDDPRLACAALNLLDLENAMVYDFIITNETIFALYEHLPFNALTAVFTYAIPVGKRPTDVDVPTTYRIEYDTALNIVIWYIDDREVYRVTQPGLPLPNPEYLVLLHDYRANTTYPTFQSVKSTTFNGGFGTFSLLDFLPFFGTYEWSGLDVGRRISPTGESFIRPLASVPPLFPTDGDTQIRMINDDGQYFAPTPYYNGPLEVDGQGVVYSIRNFKFYEG